MTLPLSSPDIQNQRTGSADIMMTVQDNTMVTIRYVIMKNDGAVVENTMNGRGISYLHGSGVLMPEFEANMIGLSVGETKQIAIANKGMDDIKIEVRVDAIRLPTGEESKFCGPGCVCQGRQSDFAANSV